MQISLHWRLTLWWLRVRKCILAGSEEGEEEEVVPSLKVRQRQRVCLFEGRCVCRERRKGNKIILLRSTVGVCGVNASPESFEEALFQKSKRLMGWVGFVAF